MPHSGLEPGTRRLTVCMRAVPRRQRDKNVDLSEEFFGVGGISRVDALEQVICGTAENYVRFTGRAQIGDKDDTLSPGRRQLRGILTRQDPAQASGIKGFLFFCFVLFVCAGSCGFLFLVVGETSAK